GVLGRSALPFAINAAPQSRRRRRGGWRWRRAAALTDAWQRAHPDEPYDQHVQHDERLPYVEMRPFEDLAIPLPEIEQADHADDVQALHGDDARGESDELVLPRRRECEHGGDQHDRRFDAVAAGFDRHGETIAGRAQNLAYRDDARIEAGHERRR